MKIAFVHDWLTGMRGGEKVLEAALEIYPSAEIYTLIHNSRRISHQINRASIHTSWLQFIPKVHQYYRFLLPLMPRTMERFDLSSYDIVISFSHCVAKGVNLGLRDSTNGKWPMHLCYCFTPMRYVHGQFEHYFPVRSSGLIKRAAQWIRPRLARWDKGTAENVDRFVACSENVRRRIREVYGRESDVVYPPVDTEFYNRIPGLVSAPRGPYYLTVGALVAYKRVDLAIEACRILGIPLKVVGVGTEEAKLRRLAQGAQVEFLGWQPSEALKSLYQHCEALLFPQEEDFGIAAVEAMACGRPVVAYGRGGALETVVRRKTGVFFEDQTPGALAQAVRKAQGMHFDPQQLQVHAQQFNCEIFKTRLSSIVREMLRGGRPIQESVEINA